RLSPSVGDEPGGKARQVSQMLGKSTFEVLDHQQAVPRVASGRSCGCSAAQEGKRDGYSPRTGNTESREERPVGIGDGVPSASDVLEERAPQQADGPEIVADQAQAARVAGEEMLDGLRTVPREPEAATHDVRVRGGLSTHVRRDEPALWCDVVVEEEHQLGLRGV